MGRASNFWGVAFGMLWSVALALAEPVFVVDRVQVNIRADATIQAERIAVLDQGDEVEFLRRKDEWFQVRMSDGRNGWIHGDLVQERVIVLGGKVHLRTSGSLQAQSLATLGQEQELGRSRQVGDWSEVALDDGRNGWILSRFLRAKTTNVAEITTPSAVVVAIPQEQPPAVEAPPEPESRVALRQNNYAEGLTFESNGNYRQALSSFEAVLRQEPKHLKALYHAAQAHIRLDQLDAGLGQVIHGIGTQ
jgi:uncharacterized protein YgiM (DUF1202 family)